MSKAINDQTENGRRSHARVWLLVVLLLFINVIALLFTFDGAIWAAFCFLPLPVALLAYLNHFKSTTTRLLLIVVLVTALGSSLSVLTVYRSHSHLTVVDY